ncbi:hypothetical protein AAG570_011003 [Ranatra chinensis]|uniref:Uncharacterized protein n=1 Tax=Ranatra chinensis TaxID=642074 RepID=A0ABD0YJB6_9HEMI
MANLSISRAIYFSIRNPECYLNGYFCFQLRTVKCISVPTGKETPISPATSTTPAPIPRISRVPAPVFEYTDENPEPAPLDPSYKPISYKYLNVLTPNAIYYVSINF